MKLFLSGVTLLSVMGAIAFFGLSPFGKQIVQQTFGSAVGSTFNTAKIAMINWAPTTNAASSTSILNGDASDRIIKQTTYSCSGFNANFNGTAAGGLANEVFTIATTSVANVGLQGNTNFILSTNVATSATVSEVFNASTTPGGTATVNTRRWAAGTYLSINSTGTSSAAACTIGVDYIGS